MLIQLLVKRQKYLGASAKSWYCKALYGNLNFNFDKATNALDADTEERVLNKI